MTLNEWLFAATAMPDRDWWQVLWPRPDQIVRALGVRQGMNVIDLGCGYGYFTVALARQAGPGLVTAIDIDPEMLEQAKAACGTPVNCLWRLGDAMDVARLVPVPADYVLIANTFHGAPDKTAFARAVHEVLRPGGRMAVVNWHPIPREQTVVLDKPRGPDTALRLSAAQTAAAVEPAGFTLDMLVELPPYHYGVVFNRTDGRRI